MTDHAGKRFAAELSAMLAQEAHAGAVEILAGWIRDLTDPDQWPFAVAKIEREAKQHFALDGDATRALMQRVANAAARCLERLGKKGASDGS